MLEPLWQQSVNKTEGWPVKFSALLDKLQQSGFCALKPDETNLFNQQEFLSNSNPGTSTQDLVGSVTRVVGYAVVHDQDRDRDVHKPSAALGKRPASALSRPVRRSQMRWFSCDVQREPSQACALPPADGVCTAGIQPLHPGRPCRTFSFISSSLPVPRPTLSPSLPCFDLSLRPSFVPNPADPLSLFVPFPDVPLRLYAPYQPS